MHKLKKAKLYSTVLVAFTALLFMFLWFYLHYESKRRATLERWMSIGYDSSVLENNRRSIVEAAREFRLLSSPGIVAASLFIGPSRDSFVLTFVTWKSDEVRGVELYVSDIKYTYIFTESDRKEFMSDNRQIIFEVPIDFPVSVYEHLKSNQPIELYLFGTDGSLRSSACSNYSIVHYQDLTSMKPFTE
jgi:hypothetical protein